MANLFEAINGAEAPIPFSGAEYQESVDRARLTNQIACIRHLVLDQKWRTVQKLTGELRRKHPSVGFPENSVQAQLRNLRKVGYQVERRHIAKGLFEYRVLPPVNPGTGAAIREVAVA